MPVATPLHCLLSTNLSLGGIVVKDNSEFEIRKSLRTWGLEAEK